MLEPSWVGRRVTVRRVVERSPDGRLLHSDVVGDLVGLDAQTAVIETRTGPVEVPLALVSIARLVPPSTADELALDRVAALGLRAVDTEQLSGWQLRADHGFTHRANSVLPDRQLDLPLDEALGRAHDWYAERGLPLALQVPVEARRLLDAGLGERGWPFQLPTQVLVGPIDTPPPDQDGPRVDIAQQPDDDWLALYRGGEGLGAQQRALLARHPFAVFASIRLDGRTVAVGRGSVDDGWLGVMAVEVDPQYRRQGLARTIDAALRQWGAAQAARRCYLQVAAGNTAALALYRSAGYWHHHDYHYRVEPTP